MEGSGMTSSSSCLMGFGGNNINSSCSNIGGVGIGVGGGSVYPMNMMMMMPLMTCCSSSSSSSSSSSYIADHHHHHYHNNAPLTNTNHHQNQNPNPNLNPTAPPEGPSSHLILHHNNTGTGTGTGTSCYFMDTNHNNDGSSCSNSNTSSVKAKIMAHPHYHRLLAAYLDCQKVGAPAEVVARLEEACASKVAAAAAAVGCGTAAGGMGCVGEDPALDQFMEAYCEMLTKYHQELSKPFNEAMLFLSRIETQFKALALGPPDLSVCGEAPLDRTGSSEEEVDANKLINPQAEDGDLKVQLLRKYSGYLGSLKQEFMKKRKKGKLPKDARQHLLDWWSRHYKWPYPSESQKLALAEATGLEPKQINNWFINQRKRHWKPSEDMQFVVMDGAYPHYYMDHAMGNPFSMDISPSLL